MADYEFSTSYAEGIIRSIRKTEKSSAIYERLSPEARAQFDNPFREPWQPAKWLEEIGEASIAELGENAFEEITRTTMKDRVGPILMPMMKSTLATKSPGNVFKKFEDLTKVALRGVPMKWQPQDELSGSLTIVYPRPVAKHVVGSWVGVIKFVFDITSPGRIDSSVQTPDGSRLQYKVSWDAPKK